MRGTLNDQSLIYLQIAQMLEDDILRQIYQEGEQVPSTNELARSFNINPATAAKGINLLVSDGILFKKRGVGMFVSPGARQTVQKKRQTAFYGSYIKPMVKEVLETLRSRGERMVIFTSCVPEHCRTALAVHGLEQYFERVIFAQELGGDKSNPEVFRTVASMLGVKPQECTLVDDSVKSCRSAKEAGMLSVCMTISLTPHVCKCAPCAINLSKVSKNFCKGILLYIREKTAVRLSFLIIVLSYVRRRS